jgi:thiol:disulfide interchange protein
MMTYRGWWACVLVWFCFLVATTLPLLVANWDSQSWMVGIVLIVHILAFIVLFFAGAALISFRADNTLRSAPKSQEEKDLDREEKAMQVREATLKRRQNLLAREQQLEKSRTQYLADLDRLLDHA